MADNNKYLGKVKTEGVIISFVIIILLLIFAWFFEKGEIWAQVLIFIISAIVLVNYLKTPKENRRKTRLEFMEAVNSSRAGRMMKYFVYSAFAFIVLVLLSKYI